MNVAVILGRRLSRKRGKQPHFYLIYKNKTTSVAVDSPQKANLIYLIFLGRIRK